SWSRDRFIIGIRVKGITVIINSVQSLQCCTDIIEINFLRMQTSSGCLNMIFQHLATLIGLVLISHRFAPDSSCYSTDHTVLRIHSIAEEERKIWRELIDIHSATDI